MTASYQQLKQALVQFLQGQEALKYFNLENENKTCLLPLTQSLYVPGTLHQVQQVMVDVGTGYFAEMPVKDAAAFYQRKQNFIKDSLDKLEITINQKQDQRGGIILINLYKLLAVMEVIQTKLKMIQKESDAAKAEKAANSSSSLEA